MKKIIVMFSLGMLVAGTSMAQDAPQKESKARFENRDGRKHKSPEEKAEMHTKFLTKKLDLNEKQQKKLQALNLKQAQQMEALRLQGTVSTSNGPNKANFEEMKNIRANWEKEFKDIITKEQYAKYEASRKEMRANHESGKHKGRDGKGRKDHAGHAGHNG